MRKRILLFVVALIIAPIVSVIFYSCVLPPDNNKKIFYTLASIDAIICNVLYTDSRGLQYATSYTITELENADLYDVPYDSFGIKIMCRFLEDEDSTWKDPVPADYERGYDKVKYIFITSSRDYTNDYPAGRNLIDIMSVRGPDSQGEVINTFIPSLYADNRETLFTFNIPPEDEETHDLVIRYILQNQQFFSDTIKNVTIRK